MRYLTAVAALGLLLAVTGTAGATGYYVKHDFETSWTGDWAPGWECAGYRHGDEPIAKMEQVDLGTLGIGTGHGAKVYVDSAPTYSWGDPWWGIVQVTDIPTGYLDTQYDPWVSVRMYDAGYTDGDDATGQLYPLPSKVTGEDDWTDVQFGGRTVAEAEYYYTWADSPHPDWQASGVARPDSDNPDWVDLKIQLSSSDNLLHFYIDDALVGSSTRSDYLDLGSQGFGVMFDEPLSAWGDSKPHVIIDDFAYGSTVPEPLTMAGLMLGVGSLVGYVRRRRK